MRSISNQDAQGPLDRVDPTMIFQTSREQKFIEKSMRMKQEAAVSQELLADFIFVRLGSFVAKNAAIFEFIKRFAPAEFEQCQASMDQLEAKLGQYLDHGERWPRLIAHLQTSSRSTEDRY